MRYLGMDVHAKSTVWCLLDRAGEVLREGKVLTSAAAITALVQELGKEEEVLAEGATSARRTRTKSPRSRRSTCNRSSASRASTGRAADSSPARNGGSSTSPAS